MNSTDRTLQHRNDLSPKESEERGAVKCQLIDFPLSDYPSGRLVASPLAASMRQGQSRRIFTARRYA